MRYTNLTQKPSRLGPTNSNWEPVKENNKKKKTLWPLLNAGVQLYQGYRTEPLEGSVYKVSLIFSTKSPKVPGTHSLDIGRMKD